MFATALAPWFAVTQSMPLMTLLQLPLPAAAEHLHCVNRSTRCDPDNSNRVVFRRNRSGDVCAVTVAVALRSAGELDERDTVGNDVGHVWIGANLRDAIVWNHG